MHREKRVTVRLVHPYRWIWEPLEEEPTFVLRPMFGGQAVYLQGKLMLFFVARKEDWRGVLVATSREHHASLLDDFPELVPHPVLPKWLYLDEKHDRFETVAQKLVERAKRGDSQIGVERGKPKRAAKKLVIK